MRQAQIRINPDEKHPLYNGIKSVDNILILPILVSYFSVFTTKSPHEYQTTCRCEIKK